MLWAEGLVLDGDQADLNTLDGTAFSVTVGMTSQRLVGPSPKRVGLIILGGVAQNIFLSNQNDASPTNGLPISTNNNILELYLWRHGKLVQKPWFVAAAAAGTLVGVIEILRQ